MKKTRKPVDMSAVTTYPLKDRINKVSVHNFATLPESEIDLSLVSGESSEDPQSTGLPCTR